MLLVYTCVGRGDWMHMPGDSIKCYISQLLSIVFAQTECLTSLELFKQVRMAAQPVLGTLLLPYCWDYKHTPPCLDFSCGFRS